MILASNCNWSRRLLLDLLEGDLPIAVQVQGIKGLLLFLHLPHNGCFSWAEWALVLDSTLDESYIGVSKTLVSNILNRWYMMHPNVSKCFCLVLPCHCWKQDLEQCEHVWTVPFCGTAPHWYRCFRPWVNCAVVCRQSLRCWFVHIFMRKTR